MITVTIYCYLIKYRAKQTNYYKNFYINKCIIKMSHKVKDIDILRTYYIYYIHDVKKFDLNIIKIDEKSYKKILIY